MARFAVGTRVRVREGCVWPERVGCAGVIVAPPSDGTYPQPGPSECLLLLDDDPLDGGGYSDVRWSCVMSNSSVELETTA